MSNSIIRINIKRSDSLDACTCGGLYCPAEPLSMSFTLPPTRLVHDCLGPLSCQRLEPPTTLITWISLLYVSLTDSLELQDATLLESLPNYIHYNTIMKSYQETHRITSNSYQNYVYTPNSYVTSSIIISYANAQHISVPLHSIKHT